MAKSKLGELVINGTIDLVKFWPEGQSDADTVQVVIDINQKSFRFRRPGTKSFKTTSKYFDAVVVGQKLVVGEKARGKTKGKDIIKEIGKNKPVVKRYVVARLEGIDAPELHYHLIGKGVNQGISPQFNKDYRQHWSIYATRALADQLAKAKKNADGKVPCELHTQLENMKDVCDIYGRFVGQVWVTVSGRKVNLNRWLLAEGWCVPGYYDSLTSQEIAQFQSDWNTAEKHGKVPLNIVSRVLPFDPTLLAPSHGKKVLAQFQADPASFLKPDEGKLIFPKLFRRQVTWYIETNSGKRTGMYHDYLVSRADDVVYKKAAFLNGSHVELPLSSFVTPAGEINFAPDELVIHEGDSTVISRKTRKAI